MSDHNVRPSDQLRVQRAVTDAQVVCGLSFTVVFCLGSASLEDQAEAEFRRLGLTARPAVMVLVEPVAGRFVLHLGGQTGPRVTDHDCSRAVAVMDECFAETGDLADCVVRGLQELCDAAGAADGTQPQPVAVPNVLLTS